MTPRLNLGDIQGNILRGYGLPRACHLFVEIPDGHASAGRAWLGEVATRIISAELQARGKPLVAHNVAVSAAGLKALSVPEPLIAEFPEDFREGMEDRAEGLGDDLARWNRDFRSRRVHVLVTVHARARNVLDGAVQKLRDELAAHGLRQAHRRMVQRLRGGREHFGFADGFAQPSIAGAPPQMRPGPAGFSWRQPLPAGEFLLGHRDLEGVRPPGPSGPLGRNGTYLVYRELKQDVPAFRNFLAEQAMLSGIPTEVLAAKIVGRWQDGTPLVVSPEGEAAHISRFTFDPRLDDFAYAEEDPDGYRCPLGAHIRRVHPRDALGFGVKLSRRHRMIRRGMTYGPAFPEGRLVDDKRNRGLAFVCLVGSIRRQFEFVQRQWCNDGNAFGLGAERDLMVGRGDGPPSMTLQGWPPRFLRPEQPFVTTVGGEYLFVPGLEGLHAVVSGRCWG